MKKKKKEAEQSNQDTLTPRQEPEYLKRLNSKYNPDREGKVFIMPVKKRK